MEGARRLGRNMICGNHTFPFFPPVNLKSNIFLFILCFLGSDNLSSSNGSTSEIASCSYEARSCGVKNGMWLGRARKLCPGLICVPYQFQQYREVSQKLYEILASYTHEIQAVSCDEAFVDVTHYVETGEWVNVSTSSTFEYLT